MLPLVLLGIRSAPKEYLACTVSELVYGTTLRLPGDFFPPTDQAPPEYPLTVFLLLRPALLNLSLCSCLPTSMLPHMYSYGTKQVRKSLQPPHDGPFRVFSRSDSHFTVQLPNRQELAAKARLKPAYLESDTTPGPPAPASLNTMPPPRRPSPVDAMCTVRFRLPEKGAHCSSDDDDRGALCLARADILGALSCQQRAVFPAALQNEVRCCHNTKHMLGPNTQWDSCVDITAI
ncbi:uncharacterized protein LOC135369409 [Ornithodoros turicata]|uniref:uncharacterized protein LOC135369409 n=1 Tax=Ornithodoros turicata TaxID=34597 RepID=UPI00313A1EDD